VKQAFTKEGATAKSKTGFWTKKKIIIVCIIILILLVIGGVVAGIVVATRQSGSANSMYSILFFLRFQLL
jgi:flagellar basal body-associated protein FliL